MCAESLFAPTTYAITLSATKMRETNVYLLATAELEKKPVSLSIFVVSLSWEAILPFFFNW